MNQLFNFWVALTGENARTAAIVLYGVASAVVGMLAGLSIGLNLLRANLRKAGVNLPGAGRKTSKWKSGFSL